MADVDLAARENALLGQEFLTWLWYAGDTRGSFKTPSGVDFNAFLEQKVTVAGGEGDSKETATVSGPHSDLAEAKIGLVSGKKVNRALVRFARDADEWTVQVKAEDFTLSQLKTPKVESKREEGEDPDAAFLEKMYLLELSLEFFDTLYEEFLRLRVSPDKWREEVSRLRAWLKKSGS